MIPPRIIQTGRQRTLPLKERAFTANVRLLNPDYEWCFFDNNDVEQFVDREFPEYRRTFDSFAFAIQRYDFFRYLAVYRLGGFYLDLDVLLAAGLSTLRSNGCVFPFEGLTFSRLLRNQGMDWEIGNYAFGAEAGHPFLRAVIENCVRAQGEPSWAEAMMDGVPALSRAAHYVLYTTGPGLLSRTLAEHSELAPTVTVLFPEDVCDKQSWHTFGTFGVHLMDGTWRPRASRLRRSLANHREARELEKIVRLGRQRGKTRSVAITSDECRDRITVRRNAS